MTWPELSIKQLKSRITTFSTAILNHRSGRPHSLSIRRISLLRDFESTGTGESPHSCRSFNRPMETWLREPAAVLRPDVLVGHGNATQ